MQNQDNKEGVQLFLENGVFYSGPMQEIIDIDNQKQVEQMEMEIENPREEDLPQDFYSKMSITPGQNNNSETTITTSIDDIPKFTLLEVRKMKNFSNIFMKCPNTACDFFFFVENEMDLLENSHFICEKCGKQYCLNCNAPYHQKETCSAFRNRVLQDNKHLPLDEAVFGFDRSSLLVFK